MPGENSAQLRRYLAPLSRTSHCHTLDLNPNERQNTLRTHLPNEGKEQVAASPL